MNLRLGQFLRVWMCGEPSFVSLLPQGVPSQSRTPQIAMAQPNVDYSLYLVTDSSPGILGDRDLIEVVEEALRGGVTVVQYRDKVGDTGRIFASIL